ncbi:MAG: CHAD domain-containing protein [Paracoccaceae bacterium]
MPYRFLPSDPSLSHALRRIVAEELDAALAHPGHANGSSAVHDVRKRVKKVRALLRLVASGFPKGAAANTVLRDAARSIGALRDARVMLATHDTLFGDASSSPLRDLWQNRFNAAQADPDQAGQLRAFQTALVDVRGRLDGWEVRGKDARVLTRGLSRTRKRGQRALASALQDPTDVAIHDLRKRVKETWYQARLLSMVWPAVMTAMVAEADQLGEALGDHHDLSVYRNHLGQIGGSLPDGLAREADLRAGAAQDAILMTALPAARRLFAGDPAEVATLWVMWWKTWRG